MDDTYKTIENTSQGIYKEKGSKFISYAIPVGSQGEAKERLEDIRKQHHNARHHCFAWAIGKERDDYRVNDDGEPSGTAGKPIFGQILSFDITNVLIVVVRYFGGTKLGTGGLITAYKSAAADALNNAKIITRTIRNAYRIHFDYPAMNDVMRVLKENDIQQIDRRFELDCTIDFSVRKNDTDKILSVFQSLDSIKIEHLYTI